MRWVDYISTVSGGGYAGALLASFASQNTDGENGVYSESPPFASLPRGEQPKSVLTMTYSNLYLKDKLGLLGEAGRNRWPTTPAVPADVVGIAAQL